MSKLSINRSLLLWLILGSLLIFIIGAESAVLQAGFTSKFPGANDFFVRWLGGRAYLLHGTNPFDQSVAEEAQRAMFGRLARPGDKDQAYFAYPLYTLYFYWPLSLLPYDWAQAIWMTLLQFMLLGGTVLAIVLSGWRPPKWLFLVTILWGLLFYNGARAIILGQFSILVGLSLFVALEAIERRHDGRAGIFLAVTTIKPQMVFLLLVFLLIWAFFHRRRRLIGSFILSLLLLAGSSMLLIPTWPLDFIDNALAYSEYVAFGTPLENLLHYFLPANAAAPLTILLSGLFFVSLLPGWWLAFQNRPGGYTWAVQSTLIVGSLITFRSATTNQIILYLPLFFFFYRLARSGGRDRLIVGLEMGLLGLMWGVFATTLAGNWENVMMHGLLPALMLLLYALDWGSLWGAARDLELNQSRSRASTGRRQGLPVRQTP